MERIVYYKTASPYPNDFTKFCSLNGIEIDNNFLTLEGRDIKSIGVEGSFIVITLYNGTKIKGEIASIFGGYTAGEGIDREKLENEKVIETNASLIKTTEPITVEGVEIGSYNDGDIVPMGTDIQEIIRRMLTKIYDVIPVQPVSNISVTANNGSLREYYEIGTILRNVSIRVIEDQYRLGLFVGPEGWPVGEGKPPKTKIAGCNTIETRYYHNHTQIGREIGIIPLTNYNAILDTEGVNTLGANIQYSASTVQPVKSDWSPSEVTIPAGVSEENAKTFKVAYKYYYGYIPMHPWAEYTDVISEQSDLSNLNYGWCNVNTDTMIPTMESSEGNEALVLVIPSKYGTVKYTENTLSVPVDIDERWIKYNTIDYTNDTLETEYYVYILHSLIPVKYNKITFGGGN